MAWTDPTGHVFIVGEMASAATLNTYVQANLAWLGNTNAVLQQFGIGSGAAYGTVPTGGQGQVLLVQCGSYAGTTDSGGALTIPFPTTFLNGISMILACPGDTAGNFTQCAQYGAITASYHFQVIAYAFNGTLLTSTPIRVNWIAIGQ